METALIVVQVIICVLLIVAVILQKGKGAEMGAAFGVGSSSAVFGPRGPTPFLAKVTVVLAALFFINSMVLTYIMGRPKYIKAVEKISIEKTVKKPAVQPVKPATSEKSNATQK